MSVSMSSETSSPSRLTLAAGLDIEVEVERDARVARPARVRRIRAVAEKVARRDRAHAFAALRSLPR